ncbi:MAG: carboxypeptidase regulatory-like domain-containing protein [Myxococcales bacterium]|nr:carboxypeptidase regulatory-like domain-containing protein [Myxococcales bacterium]
MSRLSIAALLVPLSVVACGKDEPPPPPEQPLLAPGDMCDPSRLPAAATPDPGDDEDPQPVCAPGLACAPVDGGDGFVCGTELSIRGRVTDSLTGFGIEGALVAAFNENGEPVTDVVASDACGDYVLPVTVRREADGSYAESLKWTLSVSARDYQAFPTGLRPALPIDMADAQAVPVEASDEQEDDDAEAYEAAEIRNAATSVSLISLGPGAQGVAVAGSLGADGAGALVVAEGGPVPAPYAIADASGDFTVFNVPAGGVTLRAYRQGVQAAPATVTVGSADVADVALTIGDGELATVTGSLNVVNPGDGSVTSVVLVPASVYSAALERGPVPLGLRDPPPPAAPDVTGAFALSGVPDGTYKVLVAFENDFLVRDPDSNIAGTQIQEIVVAGGAPVQVAESFKVTGALTIRGPGADGPEEVEAVPTFTWADDSSEDGYTVAVHDALGGEVWTHEMPGGNGGDVSLAYGGPALLPGMYYQFRVTSWREKMGARTDISRTEDLRGVFVHGEAPPMEECTLADTTGGEESGGADSSG